MLTWAEFKEEMEKIGVNDDTKISFIDINYPEYLSDIDIVYGDDNEVTVIDS